MKKTICIFTACMAVGSSIGLAAPANASYEQGKVTVDLAMELSPTFNTDSAGTTIKHDGESQFKGGATVGLGHNFALQYQYSKNKMKEVVSRGANNSGTETDNGEVTSNEVNLLYKVSPNLSAYIGNQHVNGSMNFDFVFDDPANGSIHTAIDSSKNYAQAGVIVQQELSKQLTGWASVGIGPDLTDYKIGLAYKVNKNVDFDVYYSDTNYRSFANYAGTDYDMKLKGVNMGVSLKF